MNEPAERLHEAIRERLYDPATGMIYTFINPRTRKPVLPTREEAWRSIPNTAGWQTPVEDCCLCAGTSLPARLLRHAAAPSDGRETEVRDLFRGMQTLATCGRRRGFIARGVLPDGETHYLDTSVDQYTHFLYGLWRYWLSALPTEGDRAFMKRIVADICLQFEEDGFYIQTDAGSAATFGDISAMRPTRVERVLQPFAIAWKITGDEHFGDVYTQLKMEEDGRRLRILGGDPASSDCLYALLQTQLALRCLVEIEPAPETRAVFASAMRRLGRAVSRKAGDYRMFNDARLHDNWDYDWRRNWDARKTDNHWVFSQSLFKSDLYRPIRHVSTTVREPAEAILCMLLSGDPSLQDEARRHANEMGRAVSPGPIWVSDPWVHFEYALRLAEAES